MLMTVANSNHVKELAAVRKSWGHRLPFDGEAILQNNAIFAFARSRQHKVPWKTSSKYLGNTCKLIHLYSIAIAVYVNVFDIKRTSVLASFYLPARYASIWSAALGWFSFLWLRSTAKFCVSRIFHYPQTEFYLGTYNFFLQLTTCRYVRNSIRTIRNVWSKVWKRRDPIL